MASLRQLAHGELLQVTMFDRVSSGLLSLNFLLGFCVVAMFLVWLTGPSASLDQTPPQNQLTLTPAVVDDESVTDTLSSVVDEIPGNELPDVDSSTSAVAIQQITHAISSVRSREGNRWGLNDMDGRRGVTRKAVTPTDGVHATRWQILFNELDQDDYYRVLEQFEARLFVVRKSTNEIVIVPCQPNPVVTISNRRNLSQAFYFVHERAHLQSWDEQLAKKANVVTEDSFFALNFPPQVLGRLAELERQSADNKGLQLATIRRSVFRVVHTEKGFDFVLDSQVRSRIE